MARARSIVLLLSLTGALVSRGQASADLPNACSRAWAAAMRTWDPKTGVVCGCDPASGVVPSDAKDNLYPLLPSRKGGGDFGVVTVGDAALNCGTALCGLVDRWTVTRDPAVAADAAKVARGVLNLAVLHGYPGFVCRGFCADGKTTISLSSRDQYTHWVHGLWRYVSSGLASQSFIADYRRRMTEVAAFMETRVTEKSGWNFGLADDPAKDPRGICTMWGPDVWPHEAARLPMIYAAAAMATGEARWRELYERHIDKALDITLEAAKPEAKRSLSRMMTYGYYQANASLEVILAFERDAVRQNRIRQAMEMFARAARTAQDRALTCQRINRGMCWEGELLLAQLLSPTFRPGRVFDDFLSSAVMGRDLGRTDFCRIAHLTAVEKWGGSRILQLESADLVHWTKPRAILGDPSWAAYNTTICRAGDRYVLGFELGKPSELVGTPFTMFFAESTDLVSWKVVRGACMGADRYTGAPMLRHFGNWFYFFHLEGSYEDGFVTRVMRSHDLFDWELSPHVVLGYDPWDRMIHPRASFTDAERMTIAAAADVNASDLDMCEWRGKLVCFYSWGNQRGAEFSALAEADCTERAFCESFFPLTCGRLIVGWQRECCV